MESARKRRLPSLRKLYAALKDAPPNLASLELNSDGFKATFRDGVSASPAMPAQAAKPVPLVPGTPFPDDKSPIHPADLVFFPPGEADA